MTALLTGVLALASWLALAPPGGPARRIRRSLPSRLVKSAPALSVGRRAEGRGGRFAPLRRKGSAAAAVPMTVLVQQMAALLKGGRTPARLWDELWLLYADRELHDRTQGRRQGRSWRRNRGAGPPDALDATSQAILAAARAAALRGAPVASAIRTCAATGAGGSAHDGPDERKRAVWVELAACFDVAEASGCPLAEVLNRFAAHLEAEEDAEAARQTALAGPRATVRILTWLPFLGLALGVVLGVDPLSILLGMPFGMTALVAGLALTAAGRIWSARLVRAAARLQW